MLRITHSTNAAGAAKYFDEGLQRADYFSSKEQTIGEWGGQASQMLGLNGEVKKEDFVALCHNQKPDGSRLNPRHSDKRKVGYDFTFSVPKSVSVVYGVTGDERIREAFEKSVNETMRECERAMRTQKGQGKQKHYPLTQNMAWASFTHRTSRPVDGIPDPHLHRHCFVFNTTWNAEQQRFQAGEFGILKKKAPYYEAAFNARMAMKMKELGYVIDRKGYAWELSGIDSPTLAKFSRRTSQIEGLARMQEQQNGTLTAKQKEKLGALSRAKKIAGQSWESLKKIWRSWLDDEEGKKIERANARELAGEKKSKLSEVEAVSRAVDHLFERKSVVKEYQVKAEALKRSYGDLLPEQIESAMQQQNFYQEERNYMTLLTTEKAVQEEQRMLAYVREGKGRHTPLNPSYEPKAEFLNEEQKQAIHHALNDISHVTIISGGAGVGKTTLVKEIRDGIEKGGTPFYGFAPSAAASRGVMRGEGFDKADTLARLFVDQKLQEQTKNAVIWVDEAGLIGNKDMNRLFEIAKKQNARILLTGDVKQHSSVAAGDALRIMEQEGGVKVARVNEIQRQRNSPLFKKVVTLTSEGKIDTALLQLDKMGGVIELENRTKREQALVNDYVQAVKDRKSALIVSPTHKEGNQITSALRSDLKEMGVLDKKERSFLQLKNVNWTEENKSDSRHYLDPKKNLAIEFHQNAAGGHKKGDRWYIEEATGSNNLAGKKAGAAKNAPLPLPHFNRFTVYQQQELPLCRGDKIRITKGGKTREGVRINNGDTFSITGFTKAGHIRLNTGKTLDKDFGHLTHGYCTTSHSSQGKTVDRVFIAQSSQSSPAASSEQFYVSISRAKEMAKIYTDDKVALEKSVMQSGQRMSAREIANWQRIQKSRKELVKKKELVHHNQKQPHYGRKGKSL